VYDIIDFTITDSWDESITFGPGGVTSDTPKLSLLPKYLSNYKKPSVADEESIPGGGVSNGNLCKDLVKIPSSYSFPRTIIKDLSNLTESFTREE
jgi:hypothetical protein